MVRASLTAKNQPALCGRFMEAFAAVAGEEGCPVSGWKRTCEQIWNGERLFVEWSWQDADSTPAATLGIQLFPKEGRVFIGSIEVREELREQGVGSAIVEMLEKTAAGVGHRNGKWRFRLFAKSDVAEFWRKLGYQHEADARYLWK